MTGAGHLAVPVVYRVVDKAWPTEDTATLSVVPVTGPLPTFEPAQAAMVGAWGVGEAAISVSSDPDISTHHEYTIRRAGPISGALVDTPVGGTITVRGPFGRPWPLDQLGSDHLLVVAGGLGLAPMRAAIERVLRRPAPGRVTIRYGATSPDEVLYADDVRRWTEAGADVVVTVDRADATWPGPVGLVTELLDPVLLAGDTDTIAFVCGPDVMMRATTDRLVDLGLPLTRIWLTLERNMQCGTGVCGHCQLGPFVVCRDGPVFDAAGLDAFYRIPEL